MSSFKKTVIPTPILALLLTATAPAFAAEGDGFEQVFKSFFGSESSKQKNETCDGDDNDQERGILGGVNSFFCHMEKDMGITGPTSAGGVTKTFQDMVVHAEVAGSADSAAYSGYDYEALVWVCKIATGVACNATNQFSRAIYMTFSYKSDKSVNKGHMIQDLGAFDGNAGSALSLTYDVGSSASPQTISAQLVCTSCGGSALKLRADASKSASQVSVVMVMVNGASADSSNSFRFSAQIDESLNQAAAYFEGPVGAGNLNSTGAPPSQFCVDRTRTATDWSYSTAASCSVSAPNFAVSANTVGAYTAAGVAGAWGGMSANPSSI